MEGMPKQPQHDPGNSPPLEVYDSGPALSMDGPLDDTFEKNSELVRQRHASERADLEMLLDGVTDPAEVTVIRQNWRERLNREARRRRFLSR
jgi:hypothetical protein